MNREEIMGLYSLQRDISSIVLNFSRIYILFVT